jgi:ferrochelatase
VQEALALLPAAAREHAVLLFAAHSIPVAMAQRSQYVQEFTRSSELVAQHLGRSRWSLAYQSRSGNPKVPWLEPDILSTIRQLHARGESHVLVVPIGFLSDNVEVLFDLDVEARATAAEAGIGYSRASTVMDQPKFIEMCAALITEALNPQAARRAQPSTHQI